MIQTSGLVLGGIGGALLAFGLLWIVDRRPGPPRPERSSSTTVGASSLGNGVRAADVSSTPAVELRAIHERLDALSEQLTELQRAVVAMGAVERVAVEPRGRAVVDVESLASAIDELEQRKLEAMTDDELLRRAREVHERGGSTADSIRLLEAALARPLSPEKRAEVTTQLAIMQRIHGTPEALAASRRSLQAIIDTNGVDSRSGLHATYQLIWTAAALDDPGRALELARTYTRSPACDLAERLQGRWAAAIMMQQLGDAGGARSEFEQLLREVDGQPERQALAEDIRRRLANF